MKTKFVLHLRILLNLCHISMVCFSQNRTNFLLLFAYNKRVDEWELNSYPHIDYTQFFNLKYDTLEIKNLASVPKLKDKVIERMRLLKDWYLGTDDTMNCIPIQIIPMDYDYTKLNQKPDACQP